MCVFLCSIAWDRSDIKAAFTLYGVTFHPVQNTHSWLSVAGVKMYQVLFTKELFIGYQFSQCDVYMHVLPGDVEFKSCVFFCVQLHRIEVT